MNQYPLKFKATKEFIQELYECEHGRYEDAQWAREQDDVVLIETNNYQCVYGDFGQRHKTQIEVRNDAELLELHYALRTGTITIHKPTAARNLLHTIAPFVAVAKGAK